MIPTPDPTPCRDRVPGGPGCPTESPGVTPTTAPVELPDDGGAGSGVVGVLGTMADVLPWVLVAVLAVAVAALLLTRRRPAPATARAPATAAAYSGAGHVAPPRPNPGPATTSSSAPPHPEAPGAMPQGHLAELLTLADLATTPAVAAQVRRVLRGLGVEPVEPPVGTPLDLDLHEVVATAPAPDLGAHERVARLHRPGWRRGREVLRPAAVELWVAAPPPRPPA